MLAFVASSVCDADTANRSVPEKLGMEPDGSGTVAVLSLVKISCTSCPARPEMEMGMSLMALPELMACQMPVPLPAYVVALVAAQD